MPTTKFYFQIEIKDRIVEALEAAMQDGDLEDVAQRLADVIVDAIENMPRKQISN